MAPPQIVLGQRASRSRPRWLLPSAAGLAVVVLLCWYGTWRLTHYGKPGAASSRLVLSHTPGETTLSAGAASLGYRGMVPWLELSGAPFAQGEQRGVLAGDRLSSVRALTRSSREAFGDVPLLSVLWDNAGPAWGLRNAPDAIPSRTALELAGLAQESDLTYEELLQGQLAFDIGLHGPRALSLIAPIRDHRGDRVLVGHGVYVPGIAPAAPLVTFASGPSVLPFAGIGWPGHLGVLAGVNAKRMAVFVHPVRSHESSPHTEGIPVSLIARTVLEQAQTLEQAIQLVRQTPSLGVARVLLVDGNTRKWVVVERSPTSAVLLRKPGRTVGSALQSKQLSSDSLHASWLAQGATNQRTANAAAALRRASVRQASDLVNVLRSRRSEDGTVLPLGHRAAVHEPRQTQSVILDPSRLLLWVSEGPGASGAYRVFDLRHRLLGEPPLPVSDLDVASARDQQTSEALRLIAAEASLRSSRRALANGTPNRANQLVLRALGQSPDLPEALMTAGDIADTLGDAPRAAAFYRRYLDAPDDLVAAQRARRYLTNIATK